MIQLAHDGGLSQSEIAARLGWPIGTVNTTRWLTSPHPNEVTVLRVGRRGRERPRAATYEAVEGLEAAGVMDTGLVPVPPARGR